MAVGVFHGLAQLFLWAANFQLLQELGAGRRFQPIERLLDDSPAGFVSKLHDGLTRRDHAQAALAGGIANPPSGEGEEQGMDSRIL